jgi:DNA-binding transcriptional MerR regulator
MKIHEISARYNITADTLRYYERIGLLPDIQRTKAGIREYSDNDCKAIEFIKCMRDAGVSIDSLIAYMDLLHQGDGTQQERKEILLKEREKLQAHMKVLKETIEKLDWKIAHYDMLGKCHKEEK